MLTLISMPEDAVIAARLKQDLEKAGYTVSDEVQPGKDHITLLVLSPQVVNQANLKLKLVQALENHQHVVPVVTAPVKLPKMIDNLQPLDFTEGQYPLSALQERITALSDPKAPRPLTVLTPSIRRSNRFYAMLLLIPVLIMFVSGILLVGGGVVLYPREEYDLKETQRVEQRNEIIIPTLTLVIPHTTQDAQSFDSTVQAMPTRLQPFLAQTATSFIVGTETPGPTAPPITEDPR